MARCLSSGTSPVVPSDRHLCDFMDGLSERIASQRRLERSDDARRSAGRMHAFARLMVSRYPGHSHAHLTMCQAFKQFAKNAWTIKDRSAVARNLGLAIEAARQALVRDPKNARAGSEVAELQKRLDELLAYKTSPRDQNVTALANGETGR